MQHENAKGGAAAEYLWSRKPRRGSPHRRRMKGAYLMDSCISRLHRSATVVLVYMVLPLLGGCSAVSGFMADGAADLGWRPPGGRTTPSFRCSLPGI